MMKVNVGGVPVDNYSRAEMASEFLDDVKSKKKCRLVFSMNGEGVYLYHRNPPFRDCINAADIVHADGMSIVKAGNKVKGKTFAERVATTDLFHDIAEVCDREHLSMFLLGAKQNVVALAAKKVRDKYPGIKFVEFQHGYFSAEEESDVVARINSIKPDIVFVGLGRPKQEAWCCSVARKLEGPVWLKTCGGLFDFLSGKSSRAPKWMIDRGLEWAYRMLREPRRLFFRYLITNVYALYSFKFKK